LDISIIKGERREEERKGIGPGDKETHFSDLGANQELVSIGLKGLEHNSLIIIPRQAGFCDRQSEIVELRACAHFLGLVAPLLLIRAISNGALRTLRVIFLRYFDFSLASTARTTPSYHFNQTTNS
jgi:hypothetical protein